MEGLRVEVSTVLNELKNKEIEMRKKRAEKRKRLPDPKFNDVLISRFINSVMIDGKKNTARKIVYDSFDLIQEKLEENPVDVFKKALSNIAPLLEIKSRRVGGATYQVPVEVRPSRQMALAMRWLVDYSRKRGEKSMPQRLAGELMDAAQGKGAAVKKREDVHRMAEANKAFSHFRF